MIRILSVSRNTLLLVKRNNALAVAGHSVCSPKTPEDAPLMLAQGDFQAVIIGHSVSPEQRKQIIPVLRKVRSEIPIIFVYASPEPGQEPLADLCVDVADDPAELVKVLDNNIASENR
jgi:DNA-binding response OmpR family regulator